MCLSITAFASFIADINANHADAAFCVVMGDLVDNGQRKAYVHFRELLATLQVPWRLMIGNHDDRAVFREAFPEAPVNGEGFVQSVLDTEAGRMIFLDTVETGAKHGVLPQGGNGVEPSEHTAA